MAGELSTTAGTKGRRDEGTKGRRIGELLWGPRELATRRIIHPPAMYLTNFEYIEDCYFP